MDIIHIIQGVVILLMMISIYIKQLMVGEIWEKVFDHDRQKDFSVTKCTKFNDSNPGFWVSENVGYYS